MSASGGLDLQQTLSQCGCGEGGPYLGASGLVFPPLQHSQVGTQPCAQVVEEDHVERDAHQGIEDTEDLACLCAGRQVPISCRWGRGCKYEGGRVRNGPPDTLAEAGFPPPEGGEVQGRGVGGELEGNLLCSHEHSSQPLLE